MNRPHGEVGRATFSDALTPSSRAFGGRKLGLSQFLGSMTSHGDATVCSNMLHEAGSTRVDSMPPRDPRRMIRWTFRGLLVMSRASACITDRGSRFGRM